MSVLGDGTIPDPVLIADPAKIATNGEQAEQYEGMLVMVEDVKILDYTKDTKEKILGFKLTGSELYVEADLHDFATSPPPVGKEYTSITGVLHYSFSNFKIFPRTAADMVEKPAP